MREGRTPRKRSRSNQVLHVVAEAPVERELAAGSATLTVADPSSVRPSLAVAAAENLEQPTASLLEAAGSAVKPVWLTVECSACGERSSIQAPMPDVRARVAAIELLLREGLGRPPQAEEVPTPRLPTSVAEVEKMGWKEMEAVAYSVFGGAELLRMKVAGLSAKQGRMLREALDELPLS